MIKTRDILPEGCPATYYCGWAQIAFLDQDGVAQLTETHDVVEIPLSVLSDKQIEAGKKQMDQLLPDALEEWTIEAGQGLIGLFRYSH